MKNRLAAHAGAMIGSAAVLLALGASVAPAQAATLNSRGVAVLHRPAPAARQASLHRHVVEIKASVHARLGAQPLYEDDLSSSITCANWSGDLSWGHEGTTAYITISNGVLEDTCSSGYARLYLHYDTIDNPKNPKVKQTGPDSGSGTPYSVTDSANSYKDIYVYICSQGDGAYRCGNKKGPGA